MSVNRHRPHRNRIYWNYFVTILMKMMKFCDRSDIIIWKKILLFEHAVLFTFDCRQAILSNTINGFCSIEMNIKCCRSYYTFVNNSICSFYFCFIHSTLLFFPIQFFRFRLVNNIFVSVYKKEATSIQPIKLTHATFAQCMSTLLLYVFFFY